MKFGVSKTSQVPKRGIPTVLFSVVQVLSLLTFNSLDLDFLFTQSLIKIELNLMVPLAVYS